MAIVAFKLRYILCISVSIVLLLFLSFSHYEVKGKFTDKSAPLGSIAPSDNTRSSPALLPTSISDATLVEDLQSTATSQPVWPSDSNSPPDSPPEPLLEPPTNSNSTEEELAPPLVIRPGPVYKNITRFTVLPIQESFPLAAQAKSPADLPPIPSWNRPPAAHVAEDTPLFIGFTRNWPLLQQAVVGYITAGWPPEDIYVVENTGTMDSNRHNILSLQNPFYLDHYRLTKVFGVNVLVTPTMLTFAQLQNFYLSEAINNNYSTYFWSHMDVLPQSWENLEPYKSFYHRSVDILRESLAPGYAVDEVGREGRWALRYLSYDWLTLVNTATSVELGGWDTMISYYGTDCDMYERMRMAGLRTDIADAGKVYDLGASLADLAVLYRLKPRQMISAGPADNGTAANLDPRQQGEDERGSGHWKRLQEQLQAMQEEKVHGALARNSWQTQQTGGQGEPYYRDIAGFEEALEITIKAGEAVYRRKWGTGRCDLIKAGLKEGDEWTVEVIND